MFDLRYLVTFSRKIDKVHTLAAGLVCANGRSRAAHAFCPTPRSHQGVRNFKDVPRNISSVASRFSHAYRYPSELRPDNKNFPTLTHKVKQHFQALTLAVRNG